MKTAVVSYSSLKNCGRWDAAFLIAHGELAPIVEELMEKLTCKELIQIAADVPYDHQAALVCFPSIGGGTFGSKRGRTYFMEKIAKIEEWRGVRHSKMTDLAVYVAMAGRGTVNKVLEEVLELKKKQIEVLTKLKNAKATLRAKGLTLFVESMVHKE